MHDFSFLAPCPSSGLIVQGDKDEVVPENAVKKLVDKLSSQRGIAIDYRVVRGAGHFFQDEMDELSGHVDDYLSKSLAKAKSRSAAGGACFSRYSGVWRGHVARSDRTAGGANSPRHLRPPPRRGSRATPPAPAPR